MIYLIGGPPKCGKTILSKQFSESAGISLLSIDSLQDSIKPYIPEQQYPAKFPVSSMRYDSNDEKYAKNSSAEVIDAYRQQARTMDHAIEAFVAAEVKEMNDYILEGYHIEPELISKLTAEFPEEVRGILVVRKDADAFLNDIRKSSLPNDWILSKTKDDSTYSKIAAMVVEYSTQLEAEAKGLAIKVFCVDQNFDAQLRGAANYLVNRA